MIRSITFLEPYRNVNIVMIDGWARAFSPGDDLVGPWGAERRTLPDFVRARIEAEWTPEVLAAWETRPQDPDLPPGPPPPDPLAEIKARLEALERAIMPADTSGIGT